MSNDSKAIQSQILDAFHFRHATKVFNPDRKISDDEFNTILEAARLSPSSFGFEPWQILVVQSPEKRELFRDFAWGANGAFNGTAGQLGTASHFLIFLAHTDSTMKHNSDYLQRFMKEVKQLPEEVIGFINQAFQKFQEHDFHIEGTRQITDWSAKQAYIAMGNVMSVAAMLGIDSCPIEGFEVDKTAEVLEQHFGIDPKQYQPAVMVALGYRADEPQFPKTRRSMDQIVSYF
ncbi:nitroreductase [Ferrimonas balearica DSM 9799]|uniref:Nitroreductase n=1 Tax=Ferrimonas balearica (strain DSM 9799 / CCM 4581 / KCTC 23876 / PAT) TaxID=550540 RepID=E1SLA3_FERBD|nr:NAD(P)H-dependent oxidoreductase [Ferrimonas balearica]ADN75481.1 nitroreductase [Ferrimonas balearica DSM 9799]